ncbi:MAG: CarD family transcriptional regulator [Hyphomicrobiaceae bacterium]
MPQKKRTAAVTKAGSKTAGKKVEKKTSSAKSAAKPVARPARSSKAAAAPAPRKPSVKAKSAAGAAAKKATSKQRQTVVLKAKARVKPAPVNATEAKKPKQVVRPKQGTQPKEMTQSKSPAGKNGAGASVRDVVAKPGKRVAAAVKPAFHGQVVAGGGQSPSIRALEKLANAMPPQSVAEKAAAARHAAIAKKPVSQRHGFRTNEYVVYPAHGVGRIVGIEEQEIGGMSLELFVITFDKDKMTLRVPTGKLDSVRMRKLSDDDIVKKAMETLKGRARIKRTMWSRRAQEYEAKINSGDLVSIAEVVRDLYRSESQPEQSYSERQLYEAALDRMAREIAAVEKLDERGAVQRITELLARSARGRRATADESSSDEVKAA